jgi:hypothetical protein
MLLPHAMQRRARYDAVEIFMVALGVICVVGATFLF